MWMSEESEQKFKPTLQGSEPRSDTADRPKRVTRREVDYRNSGEGGPSEEQGQRQHATQGVVGREILRQGSSRELRGSSTESVWGGSIEGSWSPQTISRRTETIIEGLQEVREQLTMAKKEDISMRELMKMMLEINNRDKEEARKREEEREQRATEREERRLQDIRDREEERRREENIREDRRIEREAREREQAAEREVQLLATLKAAQPAIPQTVHLDSTKLPMMTKGEDLELFLELFESALTAGGVPEAKWVPKLHASLDTETKLAIKETITNPGATYEDIKRALVGQTHLTFAAASESLMTLEQGAITKVPIRQAVQKVARLFEKLTTEATTMREMCLYSAVAVTRVALSREAKQYIDVKGSFDWNGFCCSLEEWQRTNPGRPVWDNRGRYSIDGPSYNARQPFKTPIQTRKQGDCFYCGKPGHFAAVCRSRLAGDKSAPPRQDVPFQAQQPLTRPEIPKATRGERDMSQVTCFRCRQQGHISPNCPKKPSSKVKRVQVTEDLIEMLKENEVFGAVGPHRMPVTLDTGAEITVVPEEAVEPDQFTGESRTLRSFNNSESVGKVCIVDVTVGDQILQKQAVTQPGNSLEWSACLSFDLTDPVERGVLTDQIARRAGMTHRETLYVPPEVREGILVSGIPVQEAKVVKKIKESTKGDKHEGVSVQAAEAETQPSGANEESDTTQTTEQEELVQAATAEAREVEEHEDGITTQEGKEAYEAEVDVNGMGNSEDVLVMDEVVCSASGGSAESIEFPVRSIREGMPREEMAKETATDESLQAVRKLAELNKEGFHLSHGLIWRTRMDTFGKSIQQLCVPTGFRDKCLTAAHCNFGHQGRNKMVQLLRPYFYWPNQSRSCRDYVKKCSRCQAADKTSPKPQSMTARPVVTQPFKDVAIDLVGPFPTATGGFQHMLTCVDTATRWPEAIPVRSTTSRTIIRCLTETFSRTGFPEKLTTDNGPQFVSKEFTKWLKRHGITHSKSTPYHPQGNGVVERLHRTLNAIVLKTVEARGNWARVLPLALYFIRCTPSSSTGVSPFMLTHGWEPRTPLQVLYQSWVKTDLEKVELDDWIIENQERLESIRDRATSNQIETITKRQNTWNEKAQDRQFQVGDKVWVRRPGLDHKLRESWVGPGMVVKVNSPVSFRIQTPDRLIPTVHIQQLKIAATDSVKKITAVVQDTAQEELTTSFAAANIQSQELSKEQQTELEEELSRYADVLTKDPGLTPITTFDIDTGEAEPVQQRPYSTPAALKDSVNKELSWLLEKGYIVPSSSPWSSPMVTVRKADGSARICVDFRRVNSLTRQIPFFMPRVEEVIEGIGKARFISKLDLSKGFYQVRLTDGAMEKTAFTYHKGAFHFTRMPFGVKNAPACFQSLMQKVLAEVGEFATAYMDDVVIFSSTWEDHVVHVGRVLQAIRLAGLTVNLTKCCWGGQAVEFLGHYVGRGSMSIPAHRTTALRNYTRPKSKKGLRAFLGSVGFYRRYLPKLANWTAVLTPMTSKQAPQSVEWTDEGMSAFHSICNFFCNPPNLCVPLPSDVLSIVSDASGRGVGGVLQVQREGEWTPSAYFSRQLRGAEARYSATELEALALVETVRHFAYHLYGREFVAFTDHRPLEQLLSSTRPNPRLARMAYKMQHWMVDIQYLPGVDNTFADALSREERSSPATEEEQIIGEDHGRPQEDVSLPGRPSSGGGCGGNASTEENNIG